ncbi:hypothetical protein SS50377_25453 [Spironucleus salmonicida]|uniref:Uncharacterized protein n=1 Tax=Spironucleus salmonicida TaxID=348837 RepID=V6LMR2_9EUKA|nr:hypothetical protein SS50377_25453 [Spironucleus salmonicida]|eukprot:EST45001.1 Hypothetical protein SS50377_15020 [Spironucleus salmonicida]
MSNYDISYREKIEKFKKAKESKINQLRQQMYQTQQSPVINQTSQNIAQQKLLIDGNKSIIERIYTLNSPQSKDQRTEQKQLENAKLFTYKPEITKMGQDFQRDKPVIESLYIWNDIVQKKKDTKRNQQNIKIDEQLAVGVERQAKNRSDFLASKNKFSNMKVQDRLILQQAEALKKYVEIPSPEVLGTFQPQITAKAKSKPRVPQNVFNNLYNSAFKPNVDNNILLKQSKIPSDFSQFRENDILKRHEQSLDKLTLSRLIKEDEDREMRNFRASDKSYEYLQKKNESIVEGKRNYSNKLKVEEHEFQPILNSKTIEITKERNGDANNKLYKMAEVIQQKKQQLQQNQIKQDGEFTFKPQVGQYQVKTTFEERKQAAIQKKKVISNLKPNQDIDPECTFTPITNGNTVLDQHRRIQTSQNAKTSELEARAINQHIKRLQGPSQQPLEKSANWTIEPTVQEPFCASHVTINTSEIKPDITEDALNFLDIFDINLSKQHNNKESQQLNTIVIGQKNYLTQMHKLFQGIVFQQTETQLYQQLREDRNLQFYLDNK